VTGRSPGHIQNFSFVPADPPDPLLLLQAASSGPAATAPAIAVAPSRKLRRDMPSRQLAGAFAIASLLDMIWSRIMSTRGTFLDATSQCAPSPPPPTLSDLDLVSLALLYCRFRRSNQTICLGSAPSAFSVQRGWRALKSARWTKSDVLD